MIHRSGTANLRGLVLDQGQSLLLAQGWSPRRTGPKPQVACSQIIERLEGSEKRTRRSSGVRFRFPKRGGRRRSAR